jgi:hypothetical protein
MIAFEGEGRGGILDQRYAFEIMFQGFFDDSPLRCFSF